MVPPEVQNPLGSSATDGSKYVSAKDLAENMDVTIT